MRTITSIGNRGGLRKETRVDYEKKPGWVTKGNQDGSNDKQKTINDKRFIWANQQDF